MRKPAFSIYAKTKTQISFVVTAKLIGAFVFTTRIVESLYFLNKKFQASSHLLWLYSLVCVGPGRKPRRPVFSQQGSNYMWSIHGLGEQNVVLGHMIGPSCLYIYIYMVQSLKNLLLQNQKAYDLETWNVAWGNAPFISLPEGGNTDRCISSQVQ